MLQKCLPSGCLCVCGTHRTVASNLALGICFLTNTHMACTSISPIHTSVGLFAGLPVMIQFDVRFNMLSFEYVSLLRDCKIGFE